MFKRAMSPGLAGAAALLLVLSLSGVVAGANLAGDGTPSAARVANPTFEDTDGDGVDDDCQDAVVADPEAAAAAEAAVDTDGNGAISVAEAAHSDRIGGKNCNHGGYVSTVAHGEDACDEPVVTAPEGSEDAPTACPEDPSADEPETKAPCEAQTETTTDEAPTTADRDDRSGPQRPRQGRVRGGQVGRRRRQELQPWRRRERSRACRQGSSRCGEGRSEGRAPRGEGRGEGGAGRCQGGSQGCSRRREGGQGPREVTP